MYTGGKNDDTSINLKSVLHDMQQKLIIPDGVR